MKKFYLILCVLFSGSSFALSIISDLDDTVKITNVKNTSRAINNALNSTAAFEPMPLLLKEMSHYTNQLSFVSGSPKIFNRKIRKFFRVNDIEFFAFYTRGLRQIFNSYKFKMKTISKIISDSDEEFILIGDNTENDAQVYQEIKQKFPEQVLGIYIRKVQQEEDLDNQVSFFTAFDIAIEEYIAGRMSFEQARGIGESIIRETQMSKIIPAFAMCPTDVSSFNTVKLNKLTLLDLAIKTKIIGYCKLR